MKNNIFYIFLFVMFFESNIFANAFNFESDIIVISDDSNIITSEKGKAFSDDGDLEINGNQFIYKKNNNILEVSKGGYAIYKSKNIKIEFDEAFFDKNKKNVSANGNIKIINFKNELELTTGQIHFDEKNNIITSQTRSQLKDQFGNIFLFDQFKLDVNKNLLKLSNLTFFDNQGNEMLSKLAFLNTDTGRIYGKDININFSKNYLGNENEPRLKGNSFENNSSSTILKKGIFTNCKKRDECPPWQIQAKKIEHDKEKKTILYDNATLKVYNIPVLYFPKFFHPDPTVKRRSGFLVPSIKNSSNGGDYLNLPYFLAIAENKDATISPRIFTSQKLLLQTEYRQVSKMNKHHIDTSFFLEKNNNSKTHFFYDFERNLNFKQFDESYISLISQNSSNDTYLKLNDIESDILDNNQLLENNLRASLYSDDLSIDLSTKQYEDLNKKNNNKYENIFSEINLNKNLDYFEYYGADITFNSKILSRNFDSNVYEHTNVNDLIFESFKKISSYGFNHNYQLILKNFNNTSRNSKKLKNHGSASIGGIFQHNTSFPLIKTNENYEKIFNPKLSFKFSPSHSTNQNEEYSRIDIDNVYSINRMASNTTVEEGISAVIGSNYSIFDEKKSRKILDIDFANNFRIDDSENLPHHNQINQKTSNFFNKIKYNPNKFFETTYKSSIKNNLKDITYEELLTKITLGNLSSSLEYLNENESENNNSYLASAIKYSFDNSNSVSFSTRDNKTENLTEYYNLIYEYKNDCLVASIDYKKNYYSDRDIRPSENLFFKLTIIPFGQTSSPDLKK